MKKSSSVYPFFFFAAFCSRASSNGSRVHPASSEVPDPGLRQVAGGDHPDGALGPGDFALLAHLCRPGGVGDLLGAKN